MIFNKKYFTITVALFFIELFIALFVRDTIIRPYVGDILIVILIYFFIKSFIAADIKYLAVYIFLFAVFVEILQYLNMTSFLPIVLGSTFDWADLGCYFIGCLLLHVYTISK